MRRFKTKCINCEERVLGKRYNFCTNCGYPTPKKLKEVDNPDQLIKCQLLTIPNCASNSVRVHGLVPTMKKMGYMTIDETVPRENESFVKLLDFINGE